MGSLLTRHLLSAHRTRPLNTHCAAAAGHLDRLEKLGDAGEDVVGFGVKATHPSRPPPRSSALGMLHQLKHVFFKHLAGQALLDAA